MTGLKDSLSHPNLVVRVDLWHVVTIPRGDARLEEKDIQIEHNEACPRGTLREDYPDIHWPDDAEVDVVEFKCPFAWLLLDGGWGSYTELEHKTGRVSRDFVRPIDAFGSR